MSPIDEADEALARLMSPGQSYSEIISELAQEERLRRIRRLAGSWKMTDRDYDSFMAGVYERRGRR